MEKMVTIEKIKIEPHPNADRMELAYVKGWQVCVQKGVHKDGALVLYFAVDSILPQAIEEKIFGEGAKVTLKKSRVRTIKLRGAYSQGLIAPLNLFSYKAFHDFHEGQDFTREFGVTKFEPKINKGDVLYTGNGKKVKRTENPNFNKVRKPNNIKNYPEAFMAKEVIITEKIHGCFGEETKITLANGGKLKIRDIVDNKLDVEVLTKDKNGNLSKSKIKNWFNNGKTKEWMKIKIDSKGTIRKDRGQDVSIRCTPNHEFFLPIHERYESAENLLIGDIVLHTIKSIMPNDFQKEVLIGKMLGDGSMSSGRNHLEFGQKKDHEGYVNHTLNYLGDFAGNKQKDQISGYGTIMCRARSKSSILAKEMFSNWFKTDKKEVPDNIVLSPLSLAFWYMDDGSLMHHEKQEDRASFATCNFSEESIDTLINAMKRDLDLDAVKYYTYNKGCNKKHWRVRVNKVSANKMFKIINTYVCDCMRYKLPEEYRTASYKLYKETEEETTSTIGFYEKECKIKSIEVISKEKVKKMNLTKYDIETEDHNYFANGVLVHNSSFVAGWVKRPGKTLKQKLTRLVFGEYEFCYRSMNVQLQRKDGFIDSILKKFGLSKDNPYYGTNVYASACKKYDLANKLQKGYEVAGEIYGSGIQAKYAYGCKEGERKLAVFGVRKECENMSHLDSIDIAELCNLDFVPVLFKGVLTPEILEKCTNGASVLDPKTKVREGCVIELVEANGEKIWLGHPILKSLSEAYLAQKDLTDFH